MKLVTFINSERSDFIYYLGRILSDMSASVVLIDNSENHEMFRAVMHRQPTDAEDEDMIVRGNITYLKDIAFSPEFFPSFDYIIVHMGTNYDGEYIENANEIFCMPDYRPDSLTDVPLLPDRTEYILRDHAGKLNERAVAEILDIAPEKIAGCIEYDYMDYAHYLTFLYNGRQKIAGLSETMIQALSYVTAKVTGKDEKAILKILKRERKAKQ